MENPGIGSDQETGRGGEIDQGILPDTKELLPQSNGESAEFSVAPEMVSEAGEPDGLVIAQSLPETAQSGLASDISEVEGQIRENPEVIPKAVVKYMSKKMREYKNKPYELVRSISELREKYFDDAFGRKLGSGEQTEKVVTLPKKLDTNNPMEKVA